MSALNSNESTAPKPAFFRLSGGLSWHARALRYWRLHEPFRREVHQFLSSWNPDTTAMVLVGPSAGWFLPDCFLTRFSRLTIIDLDRSAPFFFRLLHGRSLRAAAVHVRWILGDFTLQLNSTLEAEPRCAVLFCNILGQLGLERADYEAQLAALPARLAGHKWASFHDRYSKKIRPTSMSSRPGFTTCQSLDPAGLQRLGLAGEWTDHGTGQILPAGSMRRYLPWLITPARFHWVEAGAVG